MLKRILIGVFALTLLFATAVQGQVTGTRPGFSQGHVTAYDLWWAANLDSIMYLPPARPPTADSTWVMTGGVNGQIVWTQGGGGGTGYYESVALSVDTTTNATVKVAVAIPLAVQQTVSVLAMTTARAITDETASYRVEAAFFRDTAGNVTILGSSIVLSSHFSAGAAWDFDIVANTGAQTVDVQITGDIPQTVYWDTRVSYEIRGE